MVTCLDARIGPPIASILSGMEDTSDEEVLVKINWVKLPNALPAQFEKMRVTSFLSAGTDRWTGSP